MHFVLSKRNRNCRQKWWLQEWLCPPRDEGVGQTAPGVEDADDFSEQEDGRNGDGMEDLYAVGLQELVDLNAVNVAIDTRSQARMYGFVFLSLARARTRTHTMRCGRIVAVVVVFVFLFFSKVRGKHLPPLLSTGSLKLTLIQ